MTDIPDAESYEKDFDPKVYLDTFYGDIHRGIGMPKFTLDCLHELFKQGNIAGETLLDVGTGPTVHSVISASRHVTEIHLSDLVTRNRAVLQKFREGEPNAIQCFQHVINLENDGTTLEDRVSYVRGKVTKIHPIDLLLPEPLPGSKDKYDIIIGCLVLPTILRKKEDFDDGLRKLAEMLKNNGHLIIVNVLNGKFYRVGSRKFLTAPLNREETKDAFARAGLDVEVWKEMADGDYKMPPKDTAGIDDFIFVVGRKM